MRVGKELTLTLTGWSTRFLDDAPDSHAFEAFSLTHNQGARAEHVRAEHVRASHLPAPTHRTRRQTSFERYLVERDGDRINREGEWLAREAERAQERKMRERERLHWEAEQARRLEEKRQRQAEIRLQQVRRQAAKRQRQAEIFERYRALEREQGS